jgi:death-on-curing protein
VTLDEAVAFHEITLARHGGLGGVRDVTLLQSALAMPRQGFGADYAHAYPFEMAAAYAFHIAKNHPFADGNKRAALLCCGSFLRMNGWDLVSEGEEAADAILALIAGSLDKPGLAKWLEAHSQRRPVFELRDFFASVDPSTHFTQISAFQTSFQAGKREEVNATIEEASRAMPILSHLRDRSKAMELSSNREAAMVFWGQALLLIDLYRVAEDMGYEW